MFRRDFLKIAGCLAVSPTLVLRQTKNDFRFWLQQLGVPQYRDWRGYLFISKDGYVSRPWRASFGDLADCHGLNAGEEMVDMIVKFYGTRLNGK